MYGKRGFLQWQCVVPFTHGSEPIQQILGEINESSFPPFLVVIKEFGDVPSTGMLSFPKPGITLSLDFAKVGDGLFRFLAKLDQLVIAFGGKIYPAKDARMSDITFRASFPEWDQFVKYIDPKFSSSFYRRVIRQPFSPACDPGVVRPQDSWIDGARAREDMVPIDAVRAAF